MLVGRVVLEMVSHEVLGRGVGIARRRAAHDVVFSLIVRGNVLLAHEIFRAFVFVRAAILDEVSVRAGEYRGTRLPTYW